MRTYALDKCEHYFYGILEENFVRNLFSEIKQDNHFSRTIVTNIHLYFLLSAHFKGTPENMVAVHNTASCHVSLEVY